MIIPLTKKKATVFSTMKLFRYAVFSKGLMLHGFLDIKKARWFSIKTIVLLCLTTPPLIQNWGRLQIDVAGCIFADGVALQKK